MLFVEELFGNIPVERYGGHLSAFYKDFKCAVELAR